MKDSKNILSQLKDAIKEVKSGSQVEYRAEENGIVSVPIGRLESESTHLISNLKTLCQEVGSCSFCSCGCRVLLLHVNVVVVVVVVVRFIALVKHITRCQRSTNHPRKGMKGIGVGHPTNETFVLNISIVQILEVR